VLTTGKNLHIFLSASDEVLLLGLANPLLQEQKFAWLNAIAYAATSEKMIFPKLKNIQLANLPDSAKDKIREANTIYDAALSGESSERTAKLREAEKICDAVINEYAGWVHGYILRGNIYFEQHRWRRAVRFFSNQLLQNIPIFLFQLLLSFWFLVTHGQIHDYHAALELAGRKDLERKMRQAHYNLNICLDKMKKRTLEKKRQASQAHVVDSPKDKKDRKKDSKEKSPKKTKKPVQTFPGII
jgi:hypothetical protein